MRGPAQRENTHAHAARVETFPVCTDLAERYTEQLLWRLLLLLAFLPLLFGCRPLEPFHNLSLSDWRTLCRPKSIHAGRICGRKFSNLSFLFTCNILFDVFRNHMAPINFQGCLSCRFIFAAANIHSTRINKNVSEKSNLVSLVTPIDILFTIAFFNCRIAINMQLFQLYCRVHL